MNLDKAIEILGDIIRYQYSASHSDEGDAIKLGQQALLRIQRQRLLTIPVNQPPLPGEEPF